MVFDWSQTLQWSLRREREPFHWLDILFNNILPSPLWSSAKSEKTKSISMSLQRPNGNSSSSSSPKDHKTEESDEEEVLMVPDMEAAGSTGPETDHTQNGTLTGKRGRGRNPVDKEYRSHKRLLRNRVSAQEARERKKMYLSEMESRANELQNKNEEIEEKISTLMNENTMLRKMLINTRPKADDTQ